jgi:hypothetical protein
MRDLFQTSDSLSQVFVFDKMFRFVLHFSGV